jgi:hypothetical protein
MTKTLVTGRPALTAETLARLMTEAGVPCVTLVDDDAVAAAIPATPQDEGLRVVAGSMPVRVAYPIPPKGDDRRGAALSRRDSHILWLYEFTDLYRWTAEHLDDGPWVTVSTEPRPGTFTDDRGWLCSRATGSPMDGPHARWVTLETVTDADALAEWIIADVRADVGAATKRMRPSAEYQGRFRLDAAARIRAAGPRASVDQVYYHDTAREQAEARKKDLADLGHPGVIYTTAPVAGYASCATCLWPVLEAAGRWWHTHGDCPGPRKIRDLPTEPGAWEFGAISMTCGFCGESVSWPELQRSWVRLTGTWILAVLLKPARSPGLGWTLVDHQPGELLVLAETEAVAGPAVPLPHYCTQIPADLQDQYADRIAAALAAHTTQGAADCRPGQEG